MKYGLKVWKDGNTLVADTELYVNDMINDILQAKVEHLLMPLSSTATQGCVLLKDNVEKNNDSINFYNGNCIAHDKYNSERNSWYFSGLTGNVKTIAFSFGDTADHYNDPDYLVTKKINGISQVDVYNAAAEYGFYVDDEYFYTMYYGYGFKDQPTPIKKYKMNKIKFGLDGYKYSDVTKADSELINTTAINNLKINHKYNANEDINTDCYNKSTFHYGSFDGYSCCFSKNKVYFINFLNYNVIPSSLYTGTNQSAVFSVDTNVNAHTILNIIEYDINSGSAAEYTINDFISNNTTTIPAGTHNLLLGNPIYGNNDVVKIYAKAADDEFLYLKYVYGDNSMKTYKVKLDTLSTNSPVIEFVESYNANSIYIINRKNRVYRNNLGDTDMKCYGLNNASKDAIVNGNGIFKAGLCAIANVDIKLLSNSNYEVIVYIIEEE